MTSPNDTVPADPHQQALAWLVTLWSGEATAGDHLALQRWRQAAPAHEQAWQAVQAMQQRLHGVPAAMAGPVLRAASRRGSRRAVLRGLALVFGGGAAMQALHGSDAWHAMAAQYTTGTGERRALLLADGTRIDMNTATALDVRYDAGQRRIDLHRGEIMIATGKDTGAAHRAFLVHTRHGVARALGTRFVVFQNRERMQVKVYQGAVEVRALRRQGPPRRLAAGSQIQLTEELTGPVRALPLTDPAWLGGMLEAEQLRLQDFLAELARYRQGVIQCDPAVAGLPVSGMYPLADSDKVLDMLAQALPIRISYLTRYWVKVQPR